MRYSYYSLKELKQMAKQEPIYNPFTGIHLFHFRNSRRNVMHFKSADKKEIYIIFDPVQKKENKEFFWKVRDSL